MPVLVLDDFKSLFKDEASYLNLIQRFREALANHAMPLVLTNREVLFTAVSPEATHDLLCERIINRLSENPGLLDKIEEGLGDEIVE